MKIKISEFIILEALKPSEFRGLMKIGREKAIERITQIWENLKEMSLSSNRNGDRLYFNVQEDNELDNYLNEKGFEFINPKKGIVKKPNGQLIKLGKVLTMLGKKDPKAIELLNQYNVQGNIETEDENTLIVISKSPYDIAGMSTDRSWDSCMNLRDNKKEKKYVSIDIREGTIIAYLINKNDLNIKNPIARYLIKPFVNEKNEHDVLYGLDSSTSQGSRNKHFLKTLIRILDKAQGEKIGIFKLVPRLLIDKNKGFAVRLTDIQKNKFLERVKDFKDNLNFDVIKREFTWILSVHFKNAVLGGISPFFYWYNGTWEDGTWEDGTWEDGTWEDGTWKNGTWENGTWENGTWVGGLWENGTWKGGTKKYGYWLGGVWENGLWGDGVWKDGYWENGTWIDGTWKNGTWVNGTWERGIWEKGVWNNGTWKKGVWEDGIWENGLWEDGYWKNGTWNDGVWKSGTWKGGVWNGGIWKGGVWRSGVWNGGTWLANEPHPNKR